MDKYPNISGLRARSDMDYPKLEPATARQPLIGCALNDLSMHTGQLVTLIEQLEERLTPVCLVGALAANEPMAHDPSPLPAVGEEIRANTRRIEHQAERIRRILSVLEV